MRKYIENDAYVVSDTRSRGFENEAYQTHPSSPGCPTSYFSGSSLPVYITHYSLLITHCSLLLNKYSLITKKVLINQ